MALVSFPTIKYSSRFFSQNSPCSHPYISLPSNLQIPSLRKPQKKASVLGNFHSPISSHQPLIYSSFSSRHKSLALVPFDAKNSGSGEEDHRALETVLKFYTAIKNKNINQLSEIIGDECRCICNFFSFFQSYNGKTQVLAFFSYLIKSLGDNMEFVVKPTLHDGMLVGISWKLECKNLRVPLGKGFSFHIMQVYQGKVYLRNVEMFMEPLLHIEPLRLKLITYVMPLMDKMDIYLGSKSKTEMDIHIWSKRAKKVWNAMIRCDLIYTEEITTFLGGNWFLHFRSIQFESFKDEIGSILVS